MISAPLSTVFPAAWIVAAAGALVAAAVAIRAGRAATFPGAVLVVVGVLVDGIDLHYADLDAAPSLVGHLLAAAGAALMARSVGRSAWIAAACFAIAAAANLVANQAEEAAARWPVLVGYAVAAGTAIALIPAIAADLRRHPFRRFEPPSRVRLIAVPLVTAFAVWFISFLWDRDGPATKLATIALLVTFVANAAVPMVLARPPRHPSLWTKRSPPLFLVLWGVPQIALPVVGAVVAAAAGPVTITVSSTIIQIIGIGIFAALGWALVVLVDAAWRHVPAPAGRRREPVAR